MAAKTTKEKNPLPKLGRFYEITFRDTMGLSFRGLFGFLKEDREFLIASSITEKLETKEYRKF